MSNDAVLLVDDEKNILKSIERLLIEVDLRIFKAANGDEAMEVLRNEEVAVLISDNQMPGMKMMMYFMPVMLLVWFNNYASGLSYYYFLANMITFGQTIIIRRFVNTDDVLKKLDMREIQGKLTRKLSSGQMSRLTLAKAVMTHPKVLLLDEPTASLDPDITQKIKAFLKEHRRSENLSILYTSHNMREMEEMSDRIIFLQRGSIVAEGTAQQIVDRFGQRDLEEVFLKLAREERRI